jgi:hypothetical protein
METQFTLNRLLLFVAGCAVAVAPFHWFEADMAAAMLIALAALWPIVRYGDRAFFIKALVVTVLALAAFFAGCVALFESAQPW